MTAPSFVGRKRPDGELSVPPQPGEAAILNSAVLIGLLLMGVQLWALTVALDLYLGGESRRIWLLSVVSWAVFAGGLLAWWLLERARPAVRRRL